MSQQYLLWICLLTDPQLFSDQQWGGGGGVENTVQHWGGLGGQGQCFKLYSEQLHHHSKVLIWETSVLSHSAKWQERTQLQETYPPLTENTFSQEPSQHMTFIYWPHLMASPSPPPKVIAFNENSSLFFGLLFPAFIYTILWCFEYMPHFSK